jgi:cell wall-associated NlpC family hydrolase
VLILPSTPPDPKKLRQDYVRRLGSFEGTRYFWGGESYRGIDCSGLPRRAYRDALLAYGIINLNSLALRSYLEQWWFDASAQALGDGYRSYTVPLGVSGMIRKMDYSLLSLGDLAVTANKIHVLAYAGNGRWIQADPALGEVATLDGRTATNGWFDTPVTMHRWSQLEEVKSSSTNPL